MTQSAVVDELSVLPQIRLLCAIFGEELSYNYDTGERPDEKNFERAFSCIEQIQKLGYKTEYRSGNVQGIAYFILIVRDEQGDVIAFRQTGGYFGK